MAPSKRVEWPLNHAHLATDDKDDHSPGGSKLRSPPPYRLRPASPPPPPSTLADLRAAGSCTPSTASVAEECILRGSLVIDAVLQQSLTLVGAGPEANVRIGVNKSLLVVGPNVTLALQGEGCCGGPERRPLEGLRRQRQGIQPQEPFRDFSGR